MTAVASLTNIRVVVDHPIAKISKVKDLALILLISVLSLHLLSKSTLNNWFATLLLTHNRSMRCSCSSSVVNPVFVTNL